MYRKIIGNIIAAFLSPIYLYIRWLPNLFDAIVYKKYTYYDFQISSLKELIIDIYNDYLIIFLLALIIVFIPFQLIKDYFYSQKQRLSFLQKSLFLTAQVVLIIIIWGLFSNVFVLPWYKNLFYLVFAFGFGFIFSGLLYLFIDRYLVHKR